MGQHTKFGDKYPVPGFPSIVSLMLEMQQGFNEGRVAFEGAPVRGKTSFEDFARTFAKAFHGEPVPV